MQRRHQPGAAADDAREDALAEARGMAEAEADNGEGNNNPTPSVSLPRKQDRAMTLELNKE
jgi:hypothetical protein